MNIHTVMMMTMGQEAASSNSNKQKLNTKRSTEAEIVRIDYEMSLIIWYGYFLAEQGYQVRDKICYHDNQSTAKLANNGCALSIKRARHINSQYLFLDD